MIYKIKVYNTKWHKSYNKHNYWLGGGGGGGWYKFKCEKSHKIFSILC